MRQTKKWWGLLGILAVMLLLPPAVLAQWGAIQRGVDAARRGTQQQTTSPGRDAPHNVANEKVGGAGLASATTFRNKKRPFSYTCLLYTSPSPRDQRGSRMPSSA